MERPQSQESDLGFVGSEAYAIVIDLLQKDVNVLQSCKSDICLE